MILNFYMKSGNVIRVDGITKYAIENQGDAITTVRVSQRDSAKVTFLLKTIALDQIEGVTKEDEPADMPKAKRLWSRFIKGE